MVRELEITVVSAGGAALMTVDDFEKIPVQARLVRPEPLHQLAYV
ncbi:hypothetical protein RFN29_13055 [Mesorhizobium sp. VK22B]|uniref:Uncharacterized protein n=1 Tax=Mesorhizobium captivum TaxID=3072319 RepID=A0ABU4YZV4_9HYPH|nr:hypothetical protein [Mesorhizobium sp. VK22B]MDX8492508.1 hypothetical protein [Mesorhizobium sp. VK22B]